MDNQVPKPVSRERVARLGELETELKSDYYNSLVGQNVELLVESVSDLDSGDQLVRGTTCRYAPAELIATANERAINDLIKVYDSADSRAWELTHVHSMEDEFAGSIAGQRRREFTYCRCEQQT